MKQKRGESVIRLLIVADDLTGALDTGVQFADFGAVTRVMTDGWNGWGDVNPSVQVLVLDAETRHLPPQDAYRKVYAAVQNAAAGGVPFIYKKTDSALRGNIGSELQALKDASKADILPFIPAFPQMGRTTRHGIHFINEKPVQESVFGKDPFEPVDCSFVPDIIHRQTETETAVLERGWTEEQLAKCRNKIAVFDAADCWEIQLIARKLYTGGLLKASAGCAGFASAFPEILGLKKKRVSVPVLEGGLLVICGSVNPITCRQLDRAEESGFARIRLTAEQKLVPGYWESSAGRDQLDWIFWKCRTSPCCIIDTDGQCERMAAEDSGYSSEAARSHIADVLGKILGELIRRGLKRTILITGGDTLLGFMKNMGIFEAEPICEMIPGAVLSRFCVEHEIYQIISKSGGFGSDELLVQLAEKIRERERALC